MTIFSNHSLSALLTGFSSEEKRDLEDRGEKRLRTLLRGRATGASGDFYLCVGGAGSGNAEHVRELGKRAGEHIAPVLTADLRKKLLAYKNLQANGSEGDETDENLGSQMQAQDIYVKSNRGRIWVARQLVNELDSRGFNVAYPAQPNSVLRGNLLDNIQASKRNLSIKLFVAPINVMSAGVEPDAIENSNICDECLAMPAAIRKSLSLPNAESVQLYWRPEAKMDAVLVAEANEHRKLVIVDAKGFHDLVQEIDCNVSPGFRHHPLVVAALKGTATHDTQPDIAELTL